MYPYVFLVGPFHSRDSLPSPLISGVKCGMHLFAKWAFFQGSKRVIGDELVYKNLLNNIIVANLLHLNAFSWNPTMTLRRFSGLQPRSWAGQGVMWRCSAGNQWAKNGRRMSPKFGCSQWVCVWQFEFKDEYLLPCLVKNVYLFFSWQFTLYKLFYLHECRFWPNVSTDMFPWSPAGRHPHFPNPSHPSFLPFWSSLFLRRGWPFTSLFRWIYGAIVSHTILAINDRMSAMSLFHPEGSGLFDWP